MAEAQYGTDAISTARWRVPWAEALLQAGQADQARLQVRKAAPVLREQLVPGSELPGRLEALETALAAQRTPKSGGGSVATAMPQ